MEETIFQFEHESSQSDDDMRQSQHGGPCDDAIRERIDSISLRCWRPDSSRRQRRRAWWCHYHEKWCCWLVGIFCWGMIETRDLRRHCPLLLEDHGKPTREGMLVIDSFTDMRTSITNAVQGWHVVFHSNLDFEILQSAGAAATLALRERMIGCVE